MAVQVGVVGLGCMGMAHPYDVPAPRDNTSSIEVIRQALELGMTVIDSAHIYDPYSSEDLGGPRSRGAT